MFGTSVARTLEIFKIYGHFSNDAFEELYPYLRSKSIFLELISQLSEESCEDFIKICTKMFSKCQPHPDQFLKCNFESTLVFFKNKEKLANLENFLSNILINIETRKYVKKNLIFDNFVFLFRQVVKDVETFDTFINFIIDNSCSYQEIQKILNAQKVIFEIFMATNEKNYLKLSNLMKNVFASNIASIDSSLCSFPEFDPLIILKYKNSFRNFEKFLLSTAGHENQFLVNNCMIQIFRYIYDQKRLIMKFHSGINVCNCYNVLPIIDDFVNEAFEKFLCQKHELIIWIFYYEELNEIKVLSALTKIFKNYWEWAQDLLLDKFPFEAIQRMSGEIYEEFEDFLKLVFKSNKIKLSEKILNKYLNDEIMNNDNENCLKFVKTFVKFDENN
ncbi:hypothetical protein ACKWTF_015905 [Chironomus riparius]